MQCDIHVLQPFGSMVDRCWKHSKLTWTPVPLLTDNLKVLRWWSCQLLDFLDDQVFLLIKFIVTCIKEQNRRSYNSSMHDIFPQHYSVLAQQYLLAQVVQCGGKRHSCATVPLLVGRLWSSFNSSRRFSSKVSIIGRGLFGLATNTCVNTGNG